MKLVVWSMCDFFLFLYLAHSWGVSTKFKTNLLMKDESLAIKIEVMKLIWHSHRFFFIKHNHRFIIDYC